MPDELAPNVSGEIESMDQDYIATINELKQNTVTKDKYLQLKEENKRLLSSLANGETLAVEKAEPTESVSELREKLFDSNQDISNLDYISNALKLRAALIEQGESDPFLPTGRKILPTDDDIATANRVASVLQECVDYADGDSSIFTNELQRRLVDTNPIRRR